MFSDINDILGAFYKCFISALLYLLLTSPHCLANTTPIIHLPASSPEEALILDILHLAIEKSGQQHEYHYLESANHSSEDLDEKLKNGALSVIWTATSKHLEKEMYPIRIPVLKGLLGYRILLIRQGEQSKFDRIKTLQDLRAIPTGQGRFWSHTPILKNANLNVIAPIKYQNLFYMLEGGRFDSIPRAIYEPWSETNTWQHLNLTVEKNILLTYPFAIYFFVSHENKALGKVIDSGMRNAVADGSFDRLFFAHPLIQNSLEKSNLKGRRVFHLNNPNLSPLTPLDQVSFWLNVRNKQ